MNTFIAPICPPSARPCALALLLVCGTTAAAEDYFFPSSAHDLGRGQYWVVDEFSEGANILDVKVKRWDETDRGWTRRKEGISASEYEKAPTNDKHLTFGVPLYAPADGEIISCWRNSPDNPVPGEKLPSVMKTILQSGNHVYIKTAGGFAFAVAHLQQGSLPATLCPFNDTFVKDAKDRLANDCPSSADDPSGFAKEAFVAAGKRAKVKKGQYIGNAGNSGNSGAPHIHVHLRPLSGSVMCPSIAIAFDGAWRQAYASDKPASDAGWKPMAGSAITSAVGHSAILPGYRPGLAEIARHGIPAGDYQFTFDHITSSGYFLAWIDGYEVQGKNFYNALFRPSDGVARAARHGLDAAQYQAEHDKLKAQGLRLVHVDSYRDGNSVRYAAIFAKDGGPRVTAYHGIDADEHQQRFDALTRSGWRPQVISVVSVGGARAYTALYEKGPVGNLRSKSFLTADQYQQEYDENKRDGLRLVYLNAYEHDGQPRFAAIWSSAGSGTTRAKHGLDGSHYQEAWAAAMKEGFRTQAVAGYEEAGRARFAAYWRK